MSSAKQPDITPATDGPLLVKDLAHFAANNGAITCKESMALCRCGQSASKPFCDGSHRKTGFSSNNQNSALPDIKHSYLGEKVTIHDNRKLCAHAGICTDKLAQVFRLNQEPWIDPDGASVEEIITLIKQCPSGALSYSYSNTALDDAQKSAISDLEPAIFIAPNGPYVVTGDINLSGTNWGEGASKQQYTLCRCGASKNKPFCDGSHWAIEFSAD